MTNNNNNEFEKMLFELCEKENETPMYVSKAIKDALKDARSLKNNALSKLKRVAVIILCFGLVTSGVVFAKDIINFIVSVFTNSTPAIETAIENGYIQNVDMDFIYNHDVGIKIDYLLMDDSNLDISVLYDCTKNNISEISIAEYIIRDENNNVIAQTSCNELGEYELYGESIANLCERNADLRINNSYFNESLLFKSTDFPKSNYLTFEITGLNVIENNNKYYLSGNWIFKIDIKENMVNRNSNNAYQVNANKYINNIVTDINETSFIVDIDFTEDINKDILFEMDSIILTDLSNKVYYINTMRIDKKSLHLEYDISLFDDIQDFNLYIKFNTNKETTLKLNT